MNDASSLRGFFTTVERLNLALALVAVAVTHLAVGAGPMFYGVLVGAALGVANLRGVVWLGSRAMQAQRRSRAVYALLFGCKLAVMMTIIWLVLANLDIAPLGFLIGASTLMPAIILTTFWTALQPAASAAPHAGTSSPEQHV